MKLTRWLLTSCYSIVLFYAVSRSAVEGSYCDCTSVYTESLPNGSNCPNDTEWNSWGLNCTTIEVANSTNSSSNDTDSTEASTEATTELDLELYKLTVYNYTAYNETLYPLNGTCSCNCTYGSYTNDTIYFNGANQTVTTTSETEETSTSSGTTTVTTTTVTNVQQIEGWWKVNSTTTTVTVASTTGGITSSSTTSNTAASNVSSHWTDVIAVVGNCETPEPDGLSCYNCLFIPSMDNFTVCVEENYNCPYKCMKTVYQHLGIDYYVSSCYNDSGANTCSANESCTAELCDTDYCNTWVPMKGHQHTVNLILLAGLLLIALISQSHWS